jgi:two-component system sensor histidine kinase PilS (NtrC family)
MASIGELASGIAHEIRNPLASISGSVELLKNQLPIESSDIKLIDIIFKESERLNRLISDFLLFAKPKEIEPSHLIFINLLPI